MKDNNELNLNVIYKQVYLYLYSDWIYKVILLYFSEVILSRLFAYNLGFDGSTDYTFADIHKFGFSERLFARIVNPHTCLSRIPVVRRPCLGR